MIIREMHIQECWCPKCGAGQMESVHDIIFSDQSKIKDMVGKTIKCHNCGEENVIEDCVSIIPTSYLVSSANEWSKVKSNEELKKWLEADS